VYVFCVFFCVFFLRLRSGLYTRGREGGREEGIERDRDFREGGDCRRERQRQIKKKQKKDLRDKEPTQT
jgi:hypothetical protein